VHLGREPSPDSVLNQNQRIHKKGGKLVVQQFAFTRGSPGLAVKGFGSVGSCTKGSGSQEGTMGGRPSGGGRIRGPVCPKKKQFKEDEPEPGSSLLGKGGFFFFWSLNAPQKRPAGGREKKTEKKIGEHKWGKPGA